MYGVRAISPLLVALSLLVVAVLRQPLPTKGFLVDEEEEKAAGEGKPGAETEDGSDKDIREALDGSNEGHNCKQGKDIEQGKDQVEVRPCNVATGGPIYALSCLDPCGSSWLTLPECFCGSMAGFCCTY